MKLPDDLAASLLSAENAVEALIEAVVRDCARTCLHVDNEAQECADLILHRYGLERI